MLVSLPAGCFNWWLNIVVSWIRRLFFKDYIWKRSWFFYVGLKPIVSDQFINCNVYHVGSAVDTAKGYTGAAVDTTKDYAGKAYDTSAQYAQSATDTTKDYTQRAVDTTKDYTQSAVDTTKNYGQQAMDTTKDYTTKAKDTTVDTVTPKDHDKALSEHVTETLNNLPAQLKETVSSYTQSVNSPTAHDDTAPKEGLMGKLTGLFGFGQPKQTGHTTTDVAHDTVPHTTTTGEY